MDLVDEFPNGQVPPPLIQVPPHPTPFLFCYEDIEQSYIQVPEGSQPIFRDMWRDFIWANV